MPYSAMQMAEAFIQAGELSDALESLNVHLAQSPADDSALRLRAGVLARLADESGWRDALADLAHIAAPTPDDFITRSAILERNDQRSEALDAIHQGRAAHPHDERLAERLVHILRASGDLNSARQVAESFHEDWRWSQWAGDLAAEAGDFSSALDHYSRAIAMLEARYPLRDDIPAAILNEESVSSAAALTISAVYARLLLARAHLYRERDDLNAADAGYAAARARLPDDPTIAFYQGVVAALQGDMEQAGALCRAALDAAAPPIREPLRAMLRGDDRLRALDAAL